MAVVDSSFLVALFLPYDVNHEEAREMLKNTEHVIIPYEILMETLTVLLYKEGIELVIRVYELIESTETFMIYYRSEKYSDRALTLFLNQNNRLSFFDCVAVTLAKLLKQELLSFDRNQLRIPGNK